MSASTKRKHVTREHMVGELNPPNKDESIVRIVEGRGHNLHLVADAQGQEFLVSMPSKFRRAVWIKRGDFLIVKPISEGMKVKAEITSILDSEYIQFLKDQGVWPKEFCSKVSEEYLFDGGNPNKRGEPEGASYSESSTDDSD
ncbi:probable RNA-binding protein EIF1AD [Rhodnius prolixus]|uniref:Probable RNA-binding protein EIF1AD n=2 Tax=Rhodnius TaxID=13248 RepID=T1HI14_RHOPR